MAVMLVTSTAVFYALGYSPRATAVTITRHALANGQPRGLDAYTSFAFFNRFPFQPRR